MKRILFLSFFFIPVISCQQNNVPEDVQIVLRSTENKSLLKTLNHYKNPDDSLKFKAACFLIRNIGNKGFYVGTTIDHFNKLFDWLQVATNSKGKPLNEKEAESLLDSIIKTKPVNGSMTFIKDID